MGVYKQEAAHYFSFIPLQLVINFIVSPSTNYGEHQRRSRTDKSNRLLNYVFKLSDLGHMPILFSLKCALWLRS